MTTARTMTDALSASLARPASRIGAALKAAFGIAGIWAERARARHELAGLLRHHDSYLRDTGISRDQILMEVSKPFWRP
ncbi:MAG: hypothetical protein LPL00_05015 [Alphaproteobacteria bacterium]|nr:hypothetical protein [Alphaproteobacteria bacterium]MDX5368876.1 hypothetical protein [Alphaproteobacteria bacterium]MDX5463600.1 hypothetical protein [Alphaproteobacteria bacterium]